MRPPKLVSALIAGMLIFPLSVIAQPRQNNLTVVPQPARIVSPVIDGSRTTFSIAAPQAITVSLHGSWMNPDDNCYGPLVYDAEEKAWIGQADYTSGNFRISINDSWSFTFGPKRAADLTVRDGSDIKIYHNDIAKKFVGGDANFKVNKAGTYRFKLYYESADCTWHLAVSAVK